MIDAAPVLVICVECESYVGAKAIRILTRENKCATCGSSSVMHPPAPEWKWQQYRHAPTWTRHTQGRKAC